MAEGDGKENCRGIATVLAIDRRADEVIAATSGLHRNVNDTPTVIGEIGSLRSDAAIQAAVADEHSIKFEARIKVCLKPASQHSIR